MGKLNEEEAYLAETVRYVDPDPGSTVTDPPQPPRPLEGILVVSLEQAVAAPFATRQLADLGARVIKIERPEVGDSARGYDTTVNGLSSHFVWLNRGKESLDLDVKSASGQSILHDLIDRADVLIQNLAPGAATRLGIGAADLATRYPKLITCDISGYGQGGPYSEKKAYDLLIQCETGLVSITGTEEDPAKAGISIADIATGMYAYSGILTAILDRQRTGRGAQLEISMLEALGEWMNYPLLYTMYGNTQPARAGARHATIAPYGPFTCNDGITLNLGLQNEREWARFCSIVLEKPVLASDPRFGSNHQRVAHRRELDGVRRTTHCPCVCGPSATRGQGALGRRCDTGRRRPNTDPPGHVRRHTATAEARPGIGGTHRGDHRLVGLGTAFTRSLNSSQLHRRSSAPRTPSPHSSPTRQVVTDRTGLGPPTWDPCGWRRRGGWFRR